MKVTLTPIDTWFFRDGTPFDKGGVGGVFPPTPPTVVGAMRAALARQNGWDGRGHWGPDIVRVLGDGPDDLGALRFTGPFVVHDGVPVFPVPRHVLGQVTDEGRWVPMAMLRPGAARIACDLGSSMSLAEMPDHGLDAAAFAAGDRHWVTLAGLQQILDGAVPGAEQILTDDEIWVEEMRVGIARDLDTRTVTEEGGLYSTRHARLLSCVSIGIDVEGVPPDWRTPVGTALPFGGEHRLAACDVWEAGRSLNAAHAIDRTGLVVLVALTPVLLPHEVVRGKADVGGPGRLRVLSACVDRPLRIGGWDSLRRSPLPLKNALAPGSTLFCDVGHAEALQRDMREGWLRVGHGTAAGFGLCAIGTLPVGEKTT